MITRRTLPASTSITTTPAASGITPETLTADRVRLGDAAPFSFDTLIGRARVMAGKPYAPPTTAPADILPKIDYEVHDRIKFDIAHAFLMDSPSQFPVTFFHFGMFSHVLMRIHVMEKGATREIVYDELYSDIPADSLMHKLPRGSGFAGFRLQESCLGGQGKLDWKRNNWVTFPSMSYFRTIDELHRYGFSARGIVLNMTQADKPEEFPDFMHVWLDTSVDNRIDSVMVYTLLDGPSTTDVHRFVMHRTKGVVMDIDAAIFLRKDIDRFGIVSATLVHQFLETAKGTATDRCPEVRDSDGLALWTGNGERTWHLLNDPPRTMASTFGDSNPHGSGLLQRDRNFNNYQDGVRYERCPNLWVEPLEGWGEGIMQFIEIPTDDEIRDNIAAMWVPKVPARADSQYRLCYHLHRSADEPYPTQLMRCVAMRMGNGGQPGQPRPRGVREFMAELKDDPLEKLPFSTRPEAVLSNSRGMSSYAFTEAMLNGVPGHRRAQFDLTVDREEPVDMRLFLRADSKPLSETWLY